MNNEVEVIAAGEDSFGIVLPESFLRRHKVKIGDQVWITQTTNGIAISALIQENSEE